MCSYSPVRIESGLCLKNKKLAVKFLSSYQIYLDELGIFITTDYLGLSSHDKNKKNKHKFIL